MYFNKLLRRAGALVLLAVLLAGCGGGGGGAAPTPNPTPLPILSNVLSVTVDTGPTGSGYNVNRLYAAVKVCRPGSTTQCRTIDHVLVDTGSTGLRLLSAAITPSLNLDRIAASSGFPLLSCVQFVDNTFAWGPVVTADIVLGGKTAANVPVQIIADPEFGTPAGACAGGGTAMTTSAELGANGILGLGLFADDCGSACAVTPHNGSYYTCSNASCTATTGARAGIVQQVKNPVPLFATDNNGMLIDLPAVKSVSATSLSGSIVFGVGTQTNNQPAAAVVLTTGATGYFTTLISGQSLNTSFLDTGSNGLFFDSSTIAKCVDSSVGFYCPSARTSLSATLVGNNQESVSVAFSIDNATALFVDASKAVLPSLSGPFGDTTSFDWGLPFFYGRRVFMGIEGRASVLGTGPFYAF